MFHLFKSAAARAVTYGLIGVIAVGLLIGAVRLALPFADLFRSQLEEMLSEKLSMKVRVGRLGVRLVGHVPQLTLIDAELLDHESGHTQLSLEQLRIELSLLPSVRELAPHIESVTLVGAHLVIKRSEDGTITVAGLEGIEGGDPEGMTFFLGNGRFLLANSEIRWLDEKAGANAPPLHLSDVQIHFENDEERHRIGVIARPFGDRRTRIRLVGDLRGRPLSPAEWEGEVYVHWRDVNLEQVLKERLPGTLNLGSSAIELESWNDLKGGALTESLNQVAIQGLTARTKTSRNNAAPMHLDLSKGLVRWRKTDDGWNLDVKNLTLSRNGKEQSESDLGIRFSKAADGSWNLAGGLQLLNLADARDLLAQLSDVLPERLGDLRDIRPEGTLRDLHFRYRNRLDRSPSWAVSGHTKGASLVAHKHIPGVDGLDTEFAADENRGRLNLASRNLTLDLPRLFAESIYLDQLTGEVLWERDTDGTLKISAREIAATNADIATRSRFALSFPAGGGSPFADLHMNFRDLELASVRRYIPREKLKKKKLVAWLEQAFVDGGVPAGTLLFRGNASDFPFDQAQGRFQILFEVEDGVLDYHKDWPALEAIKGEVEFLNRGMDIFVSGGRFMDSELVRGSARIPNLKKAVHVEILARANGPFSDGLRALGETPLRKKLGALANLFEAEGRSRLDLDIAIPLPRKEGKGPLRLAGELTWPEPAELSLPEQELTLTDLDGKLRFTERALHAESIAAKLWGVPVRVRIDTDKPSENGGVSAHIRASGRFPVQVLEQRLPSPVWEFAQGQSRWELRLDVDKASNAGTFAPVRYLLESDLGGVAVELPAPLGKKAAQPRKLHFSGRLAPDQELRARGGYGDLGLNLELTRGNDGKRKLRRGTFNLGGDATPLPEREGLYLSGSMPTLDLPAWLNWWSSRQPRTGGRSGGKSNLRSVDLQVKRLLLTDMAFNDVRLDLDHRGNRWTANLSSRELDGTVSMPDRPRSEPIRIELGRLDLKGVLGHEGEEGQALASGKQRSDPREAHTLDLRVESLLWGENPLGSITLRSRPEPDGLMFTDISLDGPFMSIQGDGSWKGQSEKQRTSLSIDAKGSDLGEFLRSLEYNSLFYKAPAVIGVELDWSGGPVQFSAADLEGDVEIDVGAGSLLEVEPGVGRMLGILNLDALRRRLSLDFSDLFDRGYAFEKISGALQVGNGKAEIDHLSIEGPSANIDIAGSTDLVAQEFNQIVTVTPRIGTGVALASAVAGGPLVGAAVFLADQVSGGIVDKLGSHQYILSGPWAEPEIRRGKLGGGTNRDPEEGLFLEESGRAGAEGVREPKPREAKARPLADKNIPPYWPKLPAMKGEDDKNLFLEGH
jgi:uncharacterized protein (TIGR02099 family)